MLDKSVPFIDIIMRRGPGKPLPSWGLAPGYRFVPYQPGDIGAWSRIETSVAEFDSEADARAYFAKEFLPFEEELMRRMLFVETEAGEKIATATLWWGYTYKRRHPIVHWVAVVPGHQGKGLAKALTAQVVRMNDEIEGGPPLYLHTQTWSYVAVGIYQWAGFIISNEENALGCGNERCAEAVDFINSLR